MGRTTLVDGEEQGFGSSIDAELDPMLDTQETLADPSEAARPSARALYVPSPLPMGELKKALAREAEDEATAAAPTLPPPPARDDGGAMALETPMQVPLGIAPHAPPPDLENKIDRRFASVVDSEEARSIGAKVNARAAAIAAARGIKTKAQPLPSLSEFAPIAPIAPMPPVEPVVAGAAEVASPKKKGRFATAMLFLFVLALGGAAIAAALGKLTKTDALRAMSGVRGAAAYVAQSVKKL